MADVMTREQRSRCMSRIRGRNTQPELTLRRALWREGLRYRVHPALPGRPDLVFVGSMVAVFVDGCFWHACPEHATSPATNAQFWRDKIGRNVQRDRKVDAVLRGEGWTVFRCWEHEVERSLATVVSRIKKTLRRKKSGPKLRDRRRNRR